jgi:CheY-like chemotaxis protein
VALYKAGYQADAIDDLETALLMTQRTLFQMIVVDVRPIDPRVPVRVLNGLEVCRAIRAQEGMMKMPPVPILALTGNHLLFPSKFPFVLFQVILTFHNVAPVSQRIAMVDQPALTIFLDAGFQGCIEKGAVLAQSIPLALTALRSNSNFVFIDQQHNIYQAPIVDNDSKTGTSVSHAALLKVNQININSGVLFFSLLSLDCGEIGSTNAKVATYPSSFHIIDK